MKTRLLYTIFTFLSGIEVISVKGKDDRFVTCGSSFKLLNSGNRVRLFSRDGVRFRGGSRQQAVTGVTPLFDPDSLWQVMAMAGNSCPRGRPIKCRQVIRLKHVGTGRYLHSHLYRSPLSRNPEVTAFGEGGKGDDGDHWRVECSGNYWRIEEEVRFKHEDTDRYLFVSGRVYVHSDEMYLQREVSTLSEASQLTLWKATDGVYIPAIISHLKHHEM